MQWTIPGTVLPVDMGENVSVEERFRAMFLGGGIVLSQVAAITGLEPYTIQNWVKRGFLSPPVNKKYTLRQLCRIMNINMLKAALPMEDICSLISYVNGRLDSEADDLIDDSNLYFLFIRLASMHQLMSSADGREEALAQILSGYEEPISGAKERVARALKIMLTAWAAGTLRQKAFDMTKQLKNSNSEKEN